MRGDGKAGLVAAASGDVARHRVTHARGVMDPAVLRALRAYLESMSANARAQAATERERRAIARGESSDALRLDPRWFDAFRDPSATLLDVLGDSTWVAYPPQVRSVRASHHHVPWHQDVAYQRLLGPRGHERHVTCFVPLDEEPQQRPSLQFAVGTYGELPHVARDGFGAGLDEEPQGPRARFELALGDALVFGDLVPHRTITPDPARPERRSLEFRLVRPCDAVAHKDYFDVRRGEFTRRAPSAEVA